MTTNPFFRRRTAVALGVPIVAVLAAATAGPAAAFDPAPDRAPEAVLQELTRDLGAAKSFRYSGTVKDPKATTRLTGDSTSSGRSRMTLKQGRQVSKMIRLPSRVYWNFNLAFVRANFGDTKHNRKSAGRWLVTSTRNAGELGSGIAESEPKRLAACLTRDTGSLSFGGTATVGGQPAIVVVDQGDQPGTTPRTLYLSATGPRLPLRIVQTGKRQTGGKPDVRCRGADDDTVRSDLRFSRFGAKVTITAPKRAIKF